MCVFTACIEKVTEAFTERRLQDLWIEVELVFGYFGDQLIFLLAQASSCVIFCHRFNLLIIS